jgi:poly-gamma-glutamate capsule biosynthesis protein CapA/YwtB (metallophosphatase superfamily)
MYFPTFDVATRKPSRFAAVPMHIRHFRVNRTCEEEAGWLEEMLSRESRNFGTRVVRQRDDTFLLQWG